MIPRRRHSLGALSRSFTPWSRVPDGTPERKLRVLVVDPDGVTRKYVENALTRERPSGPSIEVETARDATSALELMQATMFDALIAESELPEMSGTRFVTLLRREVRFSHLAFVFLTADRRPETKVALLEAGADDVLDKPQDAAVLGAKICSLALRKTAGAAAESTAPAFMGSFSALALPDVVSLFELSRRTGVLSVVTQRASAEIVLRDGLVWAARYGNLMGPEAFYALVVESDGEYSFSAASDPEAPRNVHDTATSLIMEASRRLDEASRYGGSVHLLAATPSRRDGGVRLPAGAPSAELARQVDAELASDVTLGELRLWNDDELEDWSRGVTDAQRLQVVLFAPLAQAVAAMMSLAAPPSERWVLAALADTPKTLGVTIGLRGRRTTLDVVACDLATVERTPSMLVRCPDIALIHPPNGNFQLLPLKRREALDEVLIALRPTLVVGVGAVALQSRLFGLRVVAEKRSALHVIAAGETGGALDLRAVLRASATAWANPGET